MPREHQHTKMEAHRVFTCSEGKLPDLVKEDEDEEDDDDQEFLEGDHMFAVGLNQPSAEICATSTISQHLAEAFKRNEEQS